MRSVFASFLILGANAFGVAVVLGACSTLVTAPDLDPSPPDGSAKDSGAYLDGALPSACAPASVEDFVPPQWTAPAPFFRPECTSADLQAFEAACSGAVSMAKYSSDCGDFRLNEEHRQCAACIFDDSPDSQGPLLSSPMQHLFANRAGCVANATGDVSNNSCAAAYQALTQCELAACAINCPLSKESGDKDFVACTEKARTGGCKAYKDSIESCDTKLRSDAGNPLAVQCLEGPEPILVELFCSGRKSDGG